MSDCITTVVDYPVNINVENDDNIFIIVNQAGIQGPPGSGGCCTGSLVNTSGFLTSGNLNLYNIDGSSSVAWGNRILRDSISNASLDWQNGILYDFFQNYSIVWRQRYMKDAGQNIVFDWNNKIISGNWVINNYISGLIGGSGISTINNTDGTYTVNYTGNNTILSPIITGGNQVSLNNITKSPFYINTGISSITWILPSVNSSVGINYQIKNRGATINLTGSFPDKIFPGYPVLNFTINSGEAYQVISDGVYWNIC